MGDERRSANQVMHTVRGMDPCGNHPKCVAASDRDAESARDRPAFNGQDRFSTWIERAAA